jgi:hypothetical protein
MLWNGRFYGTAKMSDAGNNTDNAIELMERNSKAFMASLVLSPLRVIRGFCIQSPAAMR